MTTLGLIRLLADGDNWDMHGAGWWVPMMIGMVLFWAAVILGIVWLIRGGFEQRPQPQEERPLSVLDRRFAEGALSADDYRERRSILTGATSPHRGRGVASPTIEGR